MPFCPGCPHVERPYKPPSNDEVPTSSCHRRCGRFKTINTHVPASRDPIEVLRCTFRLTRISDKFVAKPPYIGGGRPTKVWLYYAKSTPIKRHVKVKGEANPYDPTCETRGVRRA